jgi:hypothetical protein
VLTDTMPPLRTGTDVTELFVVITVVAVALIFDFTNGFHDSANAMAGRSPPALFDRAPQSSSLPSSISSEPASPPRSRKRSPVVFR